jgi:hypothetical protein
MNRLSTTFWEQKLLNYFGNAIIVEKQRGQGKSNTVFSSSITVSEADLEISWFAALVKNRLTSV